MACTQAEAEADRVSVMSSLYRAETSYMQYIYRTVEKNHKLTMRHVVFDLILFDDKL